MAADTDGGVEVLVIPEPKGGWRGRVRLPDGTIVDGTEEYLTGEIAHAAMVELAEALQAEPDPDADITDVLEQLRREGQR